MRHSANNHLDQQGVASIVITMITMVIITMIVIGFATISRREQRQSLDQQLSAQAFYAAESGIEDAQNVIRTSLASGVSFRKSHCTGSDGAGFANYPSPDGGATRLSNHDNISYTCLTVDEAPSSVEFTGVGSGNVVVPIKVDPAGAAVDHVTIKWFPTVKPTSNPSSCPADTNKSLRSQVAWNCGYGMLRTDLTITQGPLNRTGLNGNTLTAFFEPLNNNPGGAGLINFANQKGKPNLIPGQCVQAATYDGCTATITNLPSNIWNLGLRISSLYQPSNIQVKAYDSSNNSLAVSGVQASIDATGKAQDVLRRIQVRYPLVQTEGMLPGESIRSNGSICKRFLIRADFFAVDGGIVDPDLTNGMCDSANIDNTPIAPPSAFADLTSDCASSCAPGWTPPVGGKYKYTKTFTNQSNNPPGDVAGCTWDFGDGTAAVNDTSCQYNDTIVHTMPTLSPEPPYPAACLTLHYKATLTVRLLSGATATKTHNYAMPLCV